MKSSPFQKKTGIQVLPVILAAIILIISPAFCGSEVRVCTSILPLQYFVECIGASHVVVDVMVKPGQSHETYEPTPLQVAGMSDAKVFFRIGMPFEDALIEKIKTAFTNLKIIDARQGVSLLNITGNELNETSASDPHIWLDPVRVMTVAQTICDALCSIDPTHCVEYRNNRDSFLDRLKETDQRIKTILSPYGRRKFMVFHPAYGYFADAYGLTQIPLEIEGKTPGPRQTASWIEFARKENIKTIFVQPEYNLFSAQTIAKSIDGKIITLDPMSKNYFDNLVFMASEISRSFK
jgi:zinc transport system substrate-binding protein